MQVSVRGNSGKLRSSMSFATSGWVHGSILAWLAFSPGPPPKKPRSLYEQEIQPYEKHLVWYSLKDKLPDISPSASTKSAATRAHSKFDQTLVVGTKDKPGPKQMISMPAPEIKLPEPLPLPNVVAVAPPPRPVKLFSPPVPKRAEAAPAALPDAPKVAPKVDAPKLPFDEAVAKPTPRAFKPPPVTPKTAAPAVLPDAPTVTATVRDKPMPLNLANPKAPLRAFTPPPSKGQSKTPVVPLPDAPAVTAKVDTATMPLALPNPKAPLRSFTPPPSKGQAKGTAVAALPDAPSVTPAKADPGAMPLALPNPKAPLRSFTPPPSGGRAKGTATSDLPAAPDVESPAPTTTAASQSSLAIVSLTPSKIPDFPTPPGAHDAGFSAGPRPQPGDAATGGSAMIVVPGLLVKGGDKDKQPTLVARGSSAASPENLLAAARAAMKNPPPDAAMPENSHALKVSSAPDPRLEGRTVYSVAIQMPNITSYSGSWMVWFADRQPPRGGPPPQVRPPLPMRKVDPKYVASAFEEKVEGVVRLFAVIRKDGTVESVSLLRHLDDRLDRSAQEALAKWTFEPALRNGLPMDVDAVFEVPFRLAKPLK